LNPELRPGPYAGLTDLRPVLPGSELHFDVRFNRPAVAAVLVWQPRWWSPGRPAEHPLALSDDRRSAALVLHVRGGGRYRLECEAEEGVRNSFDGGAVPVRHDRPPELPPDEVRLGHEPNGVPAVPPYDRLPVRFVLRDDVAVTRAFVEYEVGDTFRP